jgi:hypothetical protein
MLGVSTNVKALKTILHNITCLCTLLTISFITSPSKSSFEEPLFLVLSLPKTPLGWYFRIDVFTALGLHS